MVFFSFKQIDLTIFIKSTLFFYFFTYLLNCFFIILFYLIHYY